MQLKEHGLLFKAEMVRAILNTRRGVWPAEPIDRAKPWKWQTRRLVKPQPVRDDQAWAIYWETASRAGKYGPSAWGLKDAVPQEVVERAPHGPVGRKLWVKETLRFDMDYGWRYNAEPDDMELTREDMNRVHGKLAECDFSYSLPVCPSVHMPRKAARLLLEIKAVRVERVREITYGGALAEGIPLRSGFWYPDGSPKLTSEIDDYLDLFSAINGQESVEKNAWVFVYEFMRVE